MVVLEKVFDVMSYCTKCGSRSPQEAEFCSNCGAPVRIQAERAPSTLPQPKVVSSSLLDRMIRAARLDPTVYEEVEADKTATTQALIVVILSSICSGIGTAISEAIAGSGLMRIGTGLFSGLFLALIVWYIWSFITYLVGTKIFGGTASAGELLRTIGFADAPGVLLIFSFIPFLGGLISFAVSIWGLVAMVVAVRHALDFSTGKAILTCVAGWIVSIVLLVIIGILLAIPFILIGL